MSGRTAAWHERADTAETSTAMPTTYETDPEHLARMWAELAPHWGDAHPQGPGPGRSPFAPDSAAPCTVCRPWQREADHYRALEAAAESGAADEAAAEAVLTPEAVDRTSAWLTAHRRLARDYERDPAISEALIRWATIITIPQDRPRRARHPAATTHLHHRTLIFSNTRSVRNARTPCGRRSRTDEVSAPRPSVRVRSTHGRLARCGN